MTSPYGRALAASRMSSSSSASKPAVAAAASTNPHANGDGGDAAPVPFIMYDDNGTFRVCEEGIARLRQVRGKLSVVTIAGPYRTGKSFLLNRMLRRQRGFTVGGTVKACTRGIWLSGDPVSENGRTYVFMDTEGLGSIDRTRTFETQLFSLALLLSSYFMVNTQGTINEQSLQQLELVVQCSKRIRVRESGDAERVSDLAHHFPAFHWVLRDFALQLQDEQGRAMTSKQYLETALEAQSARCDNSPTKGGAASDAAAKQTVDDKNRIRSTLRAVFQDRDCTTLVRPVMEERQLQHLQSLPWEQVRVQFRSQVEALRVRVFNKAAIKEVAGQPLNGAALVALAQAYVDAINKGAVPTIQSAWQSVVTIQSSVALDAGIAAYTNGMAAVLVDGDGATVLEDVAMAALHRRSHTAGLAALRDAVVGEPHERAACEARFEQRCDELHRNATRLNIMRSRESARVVLEQVWEGFTAGTLNKQYGSVAELNADLSRVEQQFMSRAAGPGKEEIIKAFIEKRKEALIKQVLEEKRVKEAALLTQATRIKHLQKELEAKRALEVDLIESHRVAMRNQQEDHEREMQRQADLFRQEMEQLKRNYQARLGEAESSLSYQERMRLQALNELDMTSEEYQAKLDMARQDQQRVSEWIMEEDKRKLAELEAEIQRVKQTRPQLLTYDDMSTRSSYGAGIPTPTVTALSSASSSSSSFAPPGSTRREPRTSSIVSPLKINFSSAR